MATYAQWAKAHDICLIAVPTVLLHHDKYDTEPEDQTFYAQLPQKMGNLGVEYIGQPKDFMYPADWFFDTDHHLQDWARAKHTARLINALKTRDKAACGN